MFRPLLVVAVLLTASPAWSEGRQGLYRFPALHGETIVFAAEGDLWSVSAQGGRARRLTTHPSEETHPAISPDGGTLAFSARYEGPTELYTMPLDGGLPTRWTYEAEASIATGWHPSGELLYTTSHYSTLPDAQLVAIDLESTRRRRIPLSQASEGTYDASGHKLFFVRPAFHRNVTKRYRGGTARTIWSFLEGAAEAECLTADYTGESHSPMWWDGRVYFVSDRDGTMNLWSMDEGGGETRQHTRHSGWDVKNPELSEGRIVYQLAADLRLYDISGDRDRQVPITLVSDFDQLREKWVKKPMSYLTSMALHPEGESVVLTARGRVFVAPAGEGRLVRASLEKGVRFRDAVFMPDGKALLALSDASGELEFVTLPASGVGEPRALTEDGKVLRFRGQPSPDGKWVAYPDNNNELWLLNVATKDQRLLSSNQEGAGDVAWSPDSRWLVFSQAAVNCYYQLVLHDVAALTTTPLTSDRVNSWNATWSPDGKWLYFLSDRHLQSLVGHPWGPRQPEPFFDQTVKLYQLALRQGLRSPFKPRDELHEPEPKEKEKEGAEQSEETPRPAPVEIDAAGLQRRVSELPVEPGNYSRLSANAKVLFWMARDTGREGQSHLMALEIGNEKPKPAKLIEGAEAYELSQNGKKLLVRKADQLYVFDAGAKAPEDLEKVALDLGGWTFSIDPREDWRQIFVDAWRLERDYFYDPGMHGVDWDAVLKKFGPLVERVTTRDELSDLIGRVVGELSALHTSVRGGDHRQGPDQVKLASLGARLQRDETAGGYRIERIYKSDPDYPSELSPLADPTLGIAEGDVIEAVNGAAALSARDVGALLRNQQGRQVRLRVRPGTGGEAREVIVVPTDDERGLRYRDWEHTRRMEAEQRSEGQLGYVHLRAMGGRDLTAWYRQFYPVFQRPGLILDMRHNNGGNIDSLILEKLLRKAWFYWKTRAGEPTWNMQYAFRGHMVVLCDRNTASDGEAFALGFKELGLGKLIGTRTWGGEVWLTSSNRLVDSGIMTAAEFGVYGPEGEWLIEGHGVDPDIEVDNLPHATFDGADAQLEAAIKHLQELIEQDPRLIPEAPHYPNKSAP
jgi:tricorn protease